MPDLIDRIGAELVRAAGVDPLPPEGQALPPEDEPRRRRGWPRRARRMRWRPLLIACGLLLAAAAAALAANLAFAPGTAVGPSVPPVPTANDGAAIPGTAKLLGLSVADPHGGPPWGLRLVHTTRGETCIQVGRLDYHTIGVLGQDGAFGNDGRFHPLSENYLDPLSCTTNDARGHAFLNVEQIGLPASASAGTPSPTSGCLGGVGPFRHPCPRADDRIVYYGLLGPDAVSVSYRDAGGRLVSSRVAGADGAYLIVVAPVPAHPAPTGQAPAPAPGVGGSSTSVAVGLSPSLFHAITYRGGRTCVITTVRSCPPVGFVPTTTLVTSAQVAAPITLHEVGVAPHLRVKISFTARVAITDSHAYYLIDVHFPHSHTCRSYEVLDNTRSDLRAGKHVTFSEGVTPRSCPGHYWGSVSYVPDVGQSGYQFGLPSAWGSLVVGRFSFHLR